jgi:Rod binding domain-containing protein
MASLGASSLTSDIFKGAALPSTLGPGAAGPAVDLARAKTPQAKARAASQDFEAVFLNSMFSEMFTDVKGDGPMGGSGAAGVWRSFMIDEYSKSFARAGGIGIADQVYGSLLAHQEAAQR